MTTVSKWLAELFGFGLKGAKAEAVKLEEAVKNEVEMLRKSLECSCGRSPTGSCLGLHKLSEEEWISHEVNPNRIITAVVKEVKNTVSNIKKEVVDELKEVEQKIEAAINETVAEIKKVKKSKAKKGETSKK